MGQWLQVGTFAAVARVPVPGEGNLEILQTVQDSQNKTKKGTLGHLI